MVFLIKVENVETREIPLLNVACECGRNDQRGGNKVDGVFFGAKGVVSS